MTLRTAVRVSARVIAVKRFDVPTPLGYGGQDVAQPDDCIATLRIGYADGLPRPPAGAGAVAILSGARCPIVGAVGMNTTMVRVADATNVRVGDEATLLGDFDGVRLDEAAAAAGTIPHKLLMSLAQATRARSGGVP
jgi:alanine racemase